MPSPDGRIDRRSLVARHDVLVTGVDAGSALSVGNGELCMTVDVTGLQTFPERYPVGGTGTLLGTQAQWGWHSTPRPPGAELARTLRRYRTGRGDVSYVDSPTMSGADDSAMDEGTRWLRANPHRLDLARIGLVPLDGTRSPDVRGCRQVLDLWTGTITSRFTFRGVPLAVTTACHPDEDVVAFRIEGPPDVVGVRIAFPYGSTVWHDAADWTRPDAHRTEVEVEPGGASVSRYFDGAVAPAHRLRLRCANVRQVGAHEVLVTSPELAVSFAVDEPSDVDAEAVFAASRAHWPRFWASGAALDLAGSSDPRAPELERRAVLSQYLTAIQCAGSLPPQETGLTTNSWRGRFHLEMHWWHAAHFALWGRPHLLARSMGFYHRIRARAEDTAAAQGYRGARWPKQVGPDGRESPSHIGPFLLWQQPHVIHLAELLRRAGDTGDHGELVEQTAHFMADVAEPTPEGFALGPPLVPAQESYADIRADVRDPPFELAYWAWGLGVAQEWRCRAGLPPDPLWDEVRENLVRPLIRDGTYAAIAVEPFTVRTDHPSMAYALGPVPDTGLVDRDVLRATLHDVLDDWDWAGTWGWDHPALAMTATRLGEPATAVDVLLRDTPKNRYLHNGHNHQTATLPLYLPGNGGLLAALALMTAGWDGGPPLPGFPEDGWTVRHEGFVRAP